jgi:hypothetical protein
MPLAHKQRSMANTAEPPRPVMGASFLQDVLRILVFKAGLDATRDLTRSMPETQLSFGTACSGTDSPVFVIAALRDLFGKSGVPIHMHHAFSCECDERKQKWIQASCPQLTTLFGDITQLCQRTALNVMSNELEPVPDVTIFIAGFSCKDVSNLNPNQSGHGGYVSHADGTTGITFDGVLGYVLLHNPKFIILENVMGLATSNNGDNLVEVKHLLERAGYIVVVLHFNANKFFLPQCRNQGRRSRSRCHTVVTINGIQFTYSTNLLDVLYYYLLWNLFMIHSLSRPRCPGAGACAGCAPGLSPRRRRDI